MNPRRILVFARDHLGDVVNTTGAIHAIRARFPEARIVVEAGASAVELLPDFEVWPRLRGGLKAKMARIHRFRGEGFDTAIILDNSHEYARLSKRAKIPEVWGCHKGRPDLFTRCVEFDPKAHDLFPVLDGVLSLFEAGPYTGPKLPPLPSVEGAPGAIACFTKASSVEKEWPEALWKELAGELKDYEVRFIAPGSEPGSWPGLEPQRSLLELAAWLKTISLLIVGDTGPAHLAAAVGCRSLVLYGPTWPGRGHPWGDQWKPLYEPNTCDMYGLGCMQGNPCPQVCMSRLTPQIVAAAAREWVRSS